jgi:hypothetical protein
VLAKALVSALVVAVLFSTIPLPYSEEGKTAVPVEGEWSFEINLEARAHVTCIVRSDRPVDVRLFDGSQSGVPISTALGTTLYRPTENLEAGEYRLVVTNPGSGEAKIEYQVHQDYIVVANMTAKNVMGLSLALSMGIVALFLYGRPRRP